MPLVDHGIVAPLESTGARGQPGVSPYDAPEPWPQAPLPPSRTHLAKAETRPLAAHGARHHPFG